MEMDNYNLQVLGISEVRWTQCGQTKKLQSGHKLCYSGHPDEKAHHTLGVGILLSRTAQKALIGWEGHGPRIMTATFRTKNPGIRLHFIQCYAPTNTAEMGEKDEFYHQVQGVISKFSGKDIMFFSQEI